LKYYIITKFSLTRIC